MDLGDAVGIIDESLNDLRVSLNHFLTHPLKVLQQKQEQQQHKLLLQRQQQQQEDIHLEGAEALPVAPLQRIAEWVETTRDQWKGSSV